MLRCAEFIELEHLSQSFAQLRQARNKFLDCVKSINDGAKEEHEGLFLSLIAGLCIRKTDPRPVNIIALRLWQDEKRGQGPRGCRHRILH